MRCLEIVPVKKPDFYRSVVFFEDREVPTIPEAAVHAEMDPIQRPRDTT
jgi:hypothetical protein